MVKLDALGEAANVQFMEKPPIDPLKIFTLIQKFQPSKALGDRQMPVLSTRSDVIVITDEAHRSQYDTLALNMRLGWVQVDVFDATSRLQHRLIQPDPGPDRKFMPEDVDAWREPSGAVRIAITATQPRPEVRLYRWRPAP